MVKWDQSAPSQALRNEAVLLADRLRTEAGWPVPRQWTTDVDDCLFVIQEFMPGSPGETLGRGTVDRGVALGWRAALDARRVVIGVAVAPATA